MVSEHSNQVEPGFKAFVAGSTRFQNISYQLNLISDNFKLIQPDFITFQTSIAQFHNISYQFSLILEHFSLILEQFLSPSLARSTCSIRLNSVSYHFRPGLANSVLLNSISNHFPTQFSGFNPITPGYRPFSTWFTPRCKPFLT
jgi:hypothetical protein